MPVSREELEDLLRGQGFEPSGDETEYGELWVSTDDRLVRVPKQNYPISENIRNTIASMVDPTLDPVIGRKITEED